METLPELVECYHDRMKVLPAKRVCGWKRSWIWLFLLFLVAAGTLQAGDVPETPPPLRLQLQLVGEGLEVHLHLRQALPASFTETLPSGAVVTIVYPMRLRRHRRMFWDGNLWKGELTVRAAFDPITGRYRCESLLGEIMVASEEKESADEAVRWLVSPPAFRVVVDGLDTTKHLYFRARAVFATSTTLLVFPETTGTDWVTTRLFEEGKAENTEAPEN